MFNKSLLSNRLVSFPFIPGVVKEFNMENKCLEIGIIFVHSFPPIISNTTFKA